jgi:putative membrane protein
MNSTQKSIWTWLGRILAVWAFEVIGLLLMARFLPGIQVDDLPSAIIVIGLLGLVNALIWPVLIYFALPFAVYTLGLASLLLNGIVLWFVGQLIPSITITNVWAGVLAALGITAINILFSTLFSIDDDQSYYRSVIQRMIKRHAQPESSDVPGFLYLEIDGLSAPVLYRAIRNGYAPTMARWLDEGSHRVVSWDCDWSSQTGAMQAGILHGNNKNMPAFRWYEKETGEVMVSNNPQNTAVLEQRISDGNGLLAGGGGARGNMFSGDADSVMFTFSTLLDLSRLKSKEFYPDFADPYSVARGVLFSLWDLWLEKWDYWRQKRRNIKPLGHRTGVYPLVRAVTTVILRELSIYTILGDMFAGRPVVYATFVGYDEVAHHSGVERHDALEVLRKIDQQFARLESASALAARPYHLIILSDHGQSHGETFKQRFGLTLEALVTSLLSTSVTVESLVGVDEGVDQINAALTEVVQDNENVPARALRRAVKPRMVDKRVALGQTQQYQAHKETQSREQQPKPEVMVLGSGNLGLIYLTKFEQRATAEQINQAHPNLLPGLIQHPGIGFILVCSEAKGAMVVGAQGTHYLDRGEIEGRDPLEHFGPNAARHVKRSDRFANVADIMVNGFYDPELDEVAAFEELIGSHGGMGGDQSKSFLMFPADLSLRFLLRSRKNLWVLDFDSEVVPEKYLTRYTFGWVDIHSREPI